MAEIRLTTQQQEVVDARDCNLLVAAAAGSGKTAVLVRRIIKKVLDKEHPQDIDRLLIVTFTNAAAAEMRERIGLAIEEALEEDPGNKHLQRQMLLLHNAQITTIHSFCLSVIREFFHVIQADPAFRIGDEAELSLLKSDVLESVLEECYGEEDTDFIRFTESFSTAGKDDQLLEYAKKLYEQSVSQLWPEEWLSGLLEKFDFTKAEAEEHPMFVDVMVRVRELLESCKTLVECTLELCEEPGGPVLYREAVSDDRELVLGLIGSAASYKSFAPKIGALSFTRLSTKKQAEVAEERKQQVKDLREVYKGILKKIAEEYFYAPDTELLADIQSMAPAMRGLISLVRKFSLAYSQAKKEKNLIDFSDLEQMALKILVKQTADGFVPTKEARVIATRFDEIMIDEYQDSNRIQEAVLGSVSGVWDDCPNVFMVGDVKQSIYRFRMACPDLFMEKYQSYTDAGAYRKIDLHKNFRSRDCVLGSINALFAGLMHADSTEVEYDEAAALYYGADYPEETKEYCTEVLFVAGEEGVREGTMKTYGAEETDSAENGDFSEDLKEEEDESLSAEERNLVRAEALAVAQRMKELKRENLQIGGRGKQHPVEYKDMVVLLRTMSGWSEQFLEVFAEEGIPAYADTSSGYFKSFEIKKTLDFLRILDNPKQDIPFAAVLHSPIAGFDAAELAQLKIRYGKVTEEKKQKSLYTVARAAAEAEPEGKAAKFFGLYDRLAAEAQYISIHELLEHFYLYSGFLDIVTVMAGGERRRGNLEMLITKAKQYESTSFSGLYDFIRYMDKLIKYEVDFGEAQVAEGGNMVRIMSIHKSKGLEFPVVFLCGMEKKFNFQDMRKRLVVHSQYGLGPDYVDPVLRVKAPTLLKKTIIDHMNEEMIAEELRVLYVAMTRAKEKLIMVGSMKKPERRFDSWSLRAQSVRGKGLLSSYVKKASTYFDFICPLVFAGEMSEDGFYVVSRWANGTGFTGNFLCGVSSDYDREEQQAEEGISAGERRRMLELLLSGDEAKEGPEREIRELLLAGENFSYEYDREAKLPVKVTVSELKRLHLEELEETGDGTQVQTGVTCEEEYEETWSEKPGTEADAVTDTVREDSYPEFLREKKEMSGSDRGTLYHHVMEILPMERDWDKKSIAAFLDALVADGRLKKEEREAVFDWKIATFVQSELGNRMRLAAQQKRLYREQPFVIGIPAKEVYADSDSSELILVQGIIDAFFEDEEGLILMDYKTDFVKTDAKTELTARYEVQLAYYKRALEQLTGKPVKEVWIYSFYAGEGFRL